MTKGEGLGKRGGAGGYRALKIPITLHIGVTSLVARGGGEVEEGAR